MYKVILALIFLFGADNISFSQSLNSKTLMSIDNEKITVKDFLRVYNKNMDLVQDQSQKNIDDYLKLYINYKLKLKEARALGYDQKDSYQKEFKNYKEQLIRAYTNDKEVTATLVSEAYDRTINEVKAQHVLVRFESDQDSLAAYKKIKELRSRFINEDFSSLRLSIHDGKSIFVEDLGYFSAFKMVYNFENAAFKTPVGQTSEPFKTQFGYHVVKVLNKRPSKGKVQVAHIMIANTQKDSTLIPENRIKELYNLLQQGSSFEDLAKQYSDDKGSSSRGGVMNPFGSGDISSEIFVDTAFELDEIGALSNPIQTQFGWHILKLISRSPVKPFEEIKMDLEQKVKRDARSNIIREKMLEKLMQRYDISQPDLNQLSQQFVRNDLESDWVLEDSISQKTFLKIESKIFKIKDFLTFLNKRKRSFKKSTDKNQLIAKQYENFLADKLFEYKKENLINENKDYANILKEYEEGLLLFDIMQDKIWNRAKKDSLGLKQYFKDNASKFTLKAKVTGTLVRSNDKNQLNRVQNLWMDGATNEAISDQINSESQLIIFSNGDFELDNSLLPQNINFELGISEIYKLDTNYVILNITSITPAEVPSFEDSRGAVISEYQAVLESDWIKALRTKYKVNVDNKILKKLKASLE